MRGFSLVSLAVILVACGSGGGDGSGSGGAAGSGGTGGGAGAGGSAGATIDGETTIGDVTGTVDAAKGSVSLAGPDGTAFIDGLPGSFAFRHADATYAMNFGQFKIDETAPDPWAVATTMANVASSVGTVSFDLIADGGDKLGSGTLGPDAAGDVHLAVEGARDTDDRARMSFKCGPGDHFLGLGGQSFDVDQRGQLVPIWVQEDGIGKRADDDYATVWFLQGRRHNTHTPMPIFVSNRGYALLLDTPVRSIFDLCSTDAGTVQIEAWEKRLDFTVFYGPTPKQAIERLTAHLGRPAMPPPFTFAPWLDAIKGSQAVRDVAQALRADHVPASVIWTEDWRGGAGSNGNYVLDENWDVDRTLYPDFEQVAQDLHAMGYKFLTYNNTFLDSTVPVYQEAIAGGFEIKKSDGSPYLFTSAKFTDTSLADLSSPDAVNWVKKKYTDGLLLGADGYMADFGEWLPTDAVLASGEDAVRAHNLYPVAFDKLNKELFDTLYKQDGVERLFFVRSAYLGSQPLVSVVWPGDQQTDFSEGDGMPSVIPMGIGLGVTGFPFFGSDIAGYMSQNTTPSTKELFFRWTSMGALSPVMRTHHGRSADLNWNWQKDAETIDHFRRWAKLHIRLYPYLAALARLATEKGTPMMRPLALDYPDFEPGWSMTDEYMLGDKLIVAPVLVQGATSRTVHLPPGSFYPLEGGTARTGDVSVQAAITELPVFVPAGTVLVLLPDTVDTLADADASSGAVTLASVKDDRELWLYPDADGAFTENGGLAYTWKAAGWAGAPQTAAWNGASVTVTNGSVTVQGTGTLSFDGGKATLEVQGGASNRSLVIAVR